MSTPPGPSFYYRADYHHVAAIIQSVSASVTTCFLFSRLWARANKYKGLWWDDYILVAAWACLMVGNGTAGAAPAYGFNVVTGSVLGGTLHVSSVTICYLAIAWSKTAFVTTLLRLTTGYAKAILWFILTMINACAVVMMVTTWVQICDTRMEKYTSLGNQHCLEMELFMWLHMSCSIILIFSDAVLAIYPWFVVRYVQMSKREKRAVASTMSLVGLSALVTIVKVVMQSKIPTNEWSAVDWSYGAVVMMGFHQGEAAIMIIAQTLPVLRVMYQGASKPSSTRSSLRGEGTRTGNAKKNPPDAGINFDTVGSVDRAGIELVQLPTGRIVTADEAGRLGETGQQQPQKTGTTTEIQGGEAAQDTAAARRESDEVHRTWEDLGLSRRAWSQSPPSSPPRGQAM